MASAFLRNLHLSHIYYSCNSQLNSSKFRSLPAKILGRSPLTSLSPEIVVDDQYRLLRAFSMNHRHFCATSTSPSAKSSSSSNVDAAPSSGSGEGTSGSRNDGGDNSGGSQSASQQGKPVRGGPVSWMSFFLLLCTGGGLVFYYDREKKRHIEEEKSGLEVVPVFISVDPERDTVEQVREYVKEFHPKLIGLTGSPDEIKNAARAYRVYYMKTEEEGSDYLVDHSIVMYLMDPNMQFVKFFGKNVDATSLADGVIQEIKQHKKLKA
ncbi:UNVERIFIED_CONTAM: protein SCO11, mitochondrial [Sesamum radiatum]|uniref:Protein SCO11, mitochondrial n=1 Tax=Sesamum radiatum TaxID=300843 RepID=A0AAW2NPP4_SESRA